MYRFAYAEILNETPQSIGERQRLADLLSIGLWIIREAEDISLGKSSDLNGLLEVSRMIAAGSNAPGGDGEDQDIVRR